jgi:hypothetical protein
MGTLAGVGLGSTPQPIYAFTNIKPEPFSLRLFSNFLRSIDNGLMFGIQTEVYTSTSTEQLFIIGGFI